MMVPFLRAAFIASSATSGVVSDSAQKMPPVWNQRAPRRPKISSQSMVPGVELRDGGVAAIGAAERRADAEAALGEVEPVADRAADAVVLDPRHALLDAALEHQVFDEAADGVVRERGDDGGVEAEAALQPAGDVVLAAALPHLERARGVDAEVAGIEPQHDFAEGHAVPAQAGRNRWERTQPPASRSGMGVERSGVGTRNSTCDLHSDNGSGPSAARRTAARTLCNFSLRTASGPEGSSAK